MRDRIAEIIDDAVSEIDWPEASWMMDPEIAHKQALDLVSAERGKIADAIIAALPEMIAPLVFNGNPHWPTSSISQCCKYSVEEQDEGSWSVSMADDTIGFYDSLDEALDAMNTHHRAAIMAAFQEVKP